MIEPFGHRLNSQPMMLGFNGALFSKGRRHRKPQHEHGHSTMSADRAHRTVSFFANPKKTTAGNAPAFRKIGPADSEDSRPWEGFRRTPIVLPVPFAFAPQVLYRVLRQPVTAQPLLQA
jgi:hypothetical protein